MNLGYGLYMAEAEGHLDTHESKVQKVLRDIRYKYNMGWEKLIINTEYLKPFGLNVSELNSFDLERIEKVAHIGRI